MFEIKSLDLFARIGKLKTSHGILETPYLFPVVDPTLRKQLVTLDELKKLGFKGIITNAYLIFKNYGHVENVHKLLNFDGIVMTDSGAYQILQYGRIEVSNREIVRFQCYNLKSDIAVILDIPSRYEDPYEKVRFSVEETLRRAYEVLDIVEACKDTLWVLPIQGAPIPELLEYAAKESTKIPYYSIYALGSPTTLLENFMLDKIVEMIAIVRRVIPPDAPLHLFGAGHPLVIPFAVALGVDLMDSASYIIYARDERYMTRRGTYRLDELDYLPCSCPICSKYSVEELEELPREERVKAIALHNLYVLQEEIKWVKQAIKEGRLWEYLRERAYSHPAAKRAFDTLIKYLDIIYKHSPRTRSEVKAVFIFNLVDVYNPHILHARIKSVEVAQPKRRDIALVPLLPWDKPLSKSKIVGLVDRSHHDIYGYVPIIGIVKLELSERYPFAQFESKYSFNSTEIEDLVYQVLELLIKYIETYGDDVNMVLFVCNDIEWTKDFASKLATIISESGMTLNIEFRYVRCL